jgi:hypothetical protein
LIALIALASADIDNQQVASAVKTVQLIFFDCIFILIALIKVLKDGKMLKRSIL